MKRQSVKELTDIISTAVAKQDWPEVVINTTEVVKQDPNLEWAWANRGVALQKLGHPIDALLNYKKANEIKETAAVHVNMAAAYWDMEQADQAIIHYHKANLIDNTIPQAHMNAGHIYKWQGKDEVAAACYRKAIEMDPEYADAQMSLGMLLLKMGEFKEGWERYEYRWKSGQLVPRGLKKPEWKGEDLSGKSILVYGEQGLGDIIQFSRYARILATQFPLAKVYVEGRQPVKRLIESVPEIHGVINLGQKVPETDYVVSMLTLAGMLVQSKKEIRARKYEYFLDDDDVDVWKNKFKQLPEGLKVGICWAGMSRTEQLTAAQIDERRSTTLSQFAELAKIPGIVFVSLQKGGPAEQIKTPPRGMHIADFTEDMHDFYETCCAAACCDLVISVDTAVVHACASVGVPTWLLSRWDGCWRWFGNQALSPWYPSLRQFVQPEPHDWDGMLLNVAYELQKLVPQQNQHELDLTMAK